MILKKPNVGCSRQAIHQRTEAGLVNAVVESLGVREVTPVRSALWGHKSRQPPNIGFRFRESVDERESGREGVMKPHRFHLHLLVVERRPALGVISHELIVERRSLSPKLRDVFCDSA